MTLAAVQGCSVLAVAPSTGGVFVPEKREQHPRQRRRGDLIRQGTEDRANGTRGQQALYSDLMQIARSMRCEHGATIAVGGHQSTALCMHCSSPFKQFQQRLFVARGDCFEPAVIFEQRTTP